MDKHSMAKLEIAIFDWDNEIRNLQLCNVCENKPFQRLYSIHSINHFKDFS